MSYQTEEQQVEQLKEWWKDNGTPLIVGAVLGLSGFAGWKYWNEEQVIAQTNASDSYLAVATAIEKDDNEALIKSSTLTKTEHPDSSYAVLAAFQLAKQAVNESKLDEAVVELEWILTNHASSDLAPTAKIRLARILIAQDKAEKALTYLNFSKESSYAEVANLVKGDALLALGKEAEALEAYQAASDAGKLTTNHPTLKMKIASLKVADVELDDSEKMIDTESDAKPEPIGEESNDDQKEEIEEGTE